MIRILRDFLGSVRADDRRRRSRYGLLLSILMLPMLLGVMGCFELPAPIGDPEKSRIDPVMNGIWVADTDDREGPLMIFEPYDKRTWLVRWAVLERDTSGVDELGVDEPEAPGGVPESGEEPVEGSGDEQSERDPVVIDAVVVPASDPCTLPMIEDFDLYVDGVALFKTWRTRISGKSFITMEFRVDIDSDEGMTPRIWWGARVWLTDDDQLAIHFIDNDFEAVEDANTRRELERVVRRHHDDPELYVDEEPILLTRVPLECYDDIGYIIEQSGLATAYE